MKMTRSSDVQQNEQRRQRLDNHTCTYRKLYLGDAEMGTPGMVKVEGFVMLARTGLAESSLRIVYLSKCDLIVHTSGNGRTRTRAFFRIFWTIECLLVAHRLVVWSGLLSVHIYTYVYIHIYAYYEQVYIYIYIYMYVQICMDCVYIYIYIYIYIYMYQNLWSWPLFCFLCVDLIKGIHFHMYWWGVHRFLACFLSSFVSLW